MINTPNSLRKHIAILGNTNAGKSTLFNLLVGQDVAIVSDIAGTTTDPISKPMELIGFGPVVFIDTAGLNDSSKLGTSRVNKTLEELNKCDLILYVSDINDDIISIPQFKVPVIHVVSKSDLSEKREYENAVYISTYDKSSLDQLLFKIIETLDSTKQEDSSMLDGIIELGNNIVAVIPIDSEAPKGRLILPQVMFLRECLDKNISVTITNENTFLNVMSNLKTVDLVVCDSQIFKFVSENLDKKTPLTSFSMLLARQKGDINLFRKGANSIENLKDGDIILMAEACTHNKSHEDIGLYKIPNLLKKVTGKELKFEYAYGFDFPKNIEKYSLICHCGGCMINKTTVLNRLAHAIEKNVPITNYGVIIAKLTGILDNVM